MKSPRSCSRTPSSDTLTARFCASKSTSLCCSRTLGPNFCPTHAAASQQQPFSRPSGSRQYPPRPPPVRGCRRNSSARVLEAAQPGCGPSFKRAGPTSSGRRGRRSHHGLSSESLGGSLGSHFHSTSSLHRRPSQIRRPHRCKPLATPPRIQHRLIQTGLWLPTRRFLGWALQC